jgi:hypothetical protein
MVTAQVAVSLTVGSGCEAGPATGWCAGRSAAEASSPRGATHLLLPVTGSILRRELRGRVRERIGRPPRSATASEGSPRPAAERKRGATAPGYALAVQVRERLTRRAKTTYTGPVSEGAPDGRPVRSAATVGTVHATRRLSLNKWPRQRMPRHPPRSTEPIPGGRPGPDPGMPARARKTTRDSARETG